MSSEKVSGSDPVLDRSHKLHPEAQRRIQAEHENLGRLVNRLDAARDIETIVPILQELHVALVDHFATEEADDGLHQAIGHTAPEKERALDELFAEHREFLVRLERLRRRADGIRQSLADMVDQGRRLAADLKAHEVRETELFLDAVYSEHGGGD